MRNKMMNVSFENEKICGIFAVSQNKVAGTGLSILVTTTERIIIISRSVSTLTKFLGWFFITMPIVYTLEGGKINIIKKKLSELQPEDIDGLRFILNNNNYIEALNEDIEVVGLDHGKIIGTNISIKKKNEKVQIYHLDEKMPFENVIQLLSLSLPDKIKY